MLNVLDRFRRGLRRLPRATEAVAAVEFALILPFMLLLYLGTIEISDLIAVDRRVTVISGTMGDLVSRWDPADGSVPTATMTDYFKASEGIIIPYSETGLKQVVTCVSVSSTGVTSVVWSRAYNGGVAKTAGATYPLPTEMNTISRGKWVIASETSYAYLPLLGMVIDSAINLDRSSYYVPRYGALISAI